MPLKKVPHFAFGLFLLTACSANPVTPHSEHDKTVLVATSAGDSSIYALACDGSNDTLLVYLHDITKDPDTIGVLAATKQRRIFGSVHTGDRVAIVRSQHDPRQAYMVVSMGALCHTWCRMVQPVLRQKAGQTAAEQHKLLEQMSSLEEEENPLKPYEVGMQLTGDNTVRTLMDELPEETEESPVEYPRPTHYNEWTLYNGQLVLSSIRADSTGTLVTERSDTAQLLLLRKDTLVLNLGGESLEFYCKE